MPWMPDPAVVALVSRGVIDPELAALVSMLLERRVPAIVAGPAGRDRDAVLDALSTMLPSDARAVELAGEAEEFEWLPEATELGWRREHNVAPAAGRDGVARASSSTAVLLARELGGTGAAAVAGGRARLVVRSLALGYGLVAGMPADGLQGVLEQLANSSVGADEDELSRLGLVLALGDVAGRPRTTAAHYVRPVARDEHGHVQRLPPAVLATWDALSERFDHFAWGVLPELASRTGLRPIEFEHEQARRAAVIRGATTA